MSKIRLIGKEAQVGGVTYSENVRQRNGITDTEQDKFIVLLFWAIFVFHLVVLSKVSEQNFVVDLLLLLNVEVPSRHVFNTPVVSR